MFGALSHFRFHWIIIGFGFFLFLWFPIGCSGPNPLAEGNQEEATSDASSREQRIEQSIGDKEPIKEAEPDKMLSCQTSFSWPVQKKTVTITPALKAWKSEINLPKEDFLSAHAYPRNSRWIKFVIFLEDPTKVYFQNSWRYNYHYDFAKEFLDPLKGKSRDEFNRLALHKKSQKVVIGAVLLIPFMIVAYNEYGITFEGHDAYHPEMTRILYKLVKSKIKLSKPMKDFYFPSFHQSDSAQRLKDCYKQKGLNLSSVDRWIQQNQCYSTGWAIGRLQEVAGKDIDKAYQNGTLKPTDILLTDRVPSEVPHVAGIISLKPTTPNSHVVILARTFQIPFGFVKDGSKEIKSLIGKEILLRVRNRYQCEVDGFATEGKVSPASRTKLLSYKKPPKIQITAKKTKGKLYSSTDSLTASDVKYFGGKASNFGLLRRAIPSNSPKSIAFSFDLWDGFMKQKMTSGKMLKEEIAAAIKGFTYPPNMAVVQKALHKIRDKIKGETKFTKEQMKAISDALKPFDSKKKIRFRSSTNVEDSSAFSGAGLYESKSGCLADDQDKDTKGPSICDVKKKKERGVFRAIRKVYASFYNFNAFLERLRFRLDENKVGMALLVHHSFPDEMELANGVATIRREGNRHFITLVTQKGAESVTNPDSEAQPEVMKGEVYGGNASRLGFYISQSSSLVPYQTTIFSTKEEYSKLGKLLFKVALAFEKANSGKKNYVLDFEYKKIKPDLFIVKQVREIPSRTQKQEFIPFLAGQTQKICVFQGEFSDVFSNHRLKSMWSLTPNTMELNEQNRKKALFKEIVLHYNSDGKLKKLQGTPTGWPRFKHIIESKNLGESFKDKGQRLSRTLTIMAEFPKKVFPKDTRILLLKDLTFYLKAKYESPISYLTYGLKIKSRVEETVRLTTNCLQYKMGAGYERKEYKFAGENGFKLQTAFYHPPGPRGATAGYTAPLVKWDKTVITGLTTQKVELKGYFSQTYRPEHHNFGEHFLFEPALEPSITQKQKDELKAKDIKMIYFYKPNEPRDKLQIRYIGFDGKIRTRRDNPCSYDGINT